MNLIFAGSRSAAISLGDGSRYAPEAPVPLTLNGQAAGNAETAVFSLYSLLPDTDYTLRADENEISFRTQSESATLDVRRFGAVGDGIHDDTAAIQAAILSCPENGRVLIPAGTYSVLPLFLKSHLRMELAKGAVLLLNPDRSKFPVLPGMIQDTDEIGEHNYGTWEGNPLDCYAALITGIQVRDILIYGEGTLDGQAQRSDWWTDPKKRRGAWRGRMVFLNRCEGVVLQGITIQNSPSWNLHPYFSQKLAFLNLTVLAPKDSPNTDGFDPESCADVLLSGCHFSLGDDCVAIKSGKIYMGKKYHTPCRNICVTNCLMENGHGGVTVGSEMAGGVQDVLIRDCVMRNTDRGLRIKTRRGRGRNGVIDRISLENVRMEHVGTPLVVNSLYFCDPDGHSPYVQSREKQPVDETTPRIGSISLKNVTADGVSCAGYVLGLPEMPVERVVLENVNISCDPKAKPMIPALAEGIGPTSRRGLVVYNTDRLEMTDVIITGTDGSPVERY